MAKIIKKALISSETITIGTLMPVSNTTDNELHTTKNTQRNETSLEDLRTQAYQQGFEAGIREGQTRIEQQVERSKHDLEKLLLSVPQAIAQCRMELNREIADIVLIISQEYFVEQQRTPEALQAQINQILNQINNEQSIELCLHPEEIKLVQKANIQLNASHLNSLKIKADDNLALGGCLIKTEHGIFDTSIETRIDRLKEYLIEIRSRGQHDSLG
ncbi:FliH/SctL family protein [uncultured Legionella sp.]|uniref:FliH/SctL family protein n=1 Tax=uncultured Legionella sp. TaxID=210934 RepID=UPI0026029FC5|nr:FliH/SctL family protein [uncultured Legionella sp.]